MIFYLHGHGLWEVVGRIQTPEEDLNTSCANGENQSMPSNVFLEDDNHTFGMTRHQKKLGFMILFSRKNDTRLQLSGEQTVITT